MIRKSDLFAKQLGSQLAAPFAPEFIRKGDLMKILKNKKGQGLIEYLIIVAIIAVGSMAVMRVVGSSLNRKFAEVAVALGAKSTGTIGEISVGKSAYQKKDLNSFMKGARADQNGKDDGDKE